MQALAASGAVPTEDCARQAQVIANNMPRGTNILAQQKDKCRKQAYITVDERMKFFVNQLLKHEFERNDRQTKLNRSSNK